MRFIFLAAALLCTFAVFSQTSDKLVARFSFSGCKTTDDSGNGSTAVLVGDTVCTCGTRDQALTFNDRKTSVLMAGPLLDLFTTSDFTISFYFKPQPTNLGGTQVILSKQVNCTSNRAFWVRYNKDSKKIASGISENDTLSAIVTAAIDPLACWQMVTLVRNNRTYSIYINGVLKDTKTTAGRLNLTSTTPFKVGDPVCPLDRGLIGALDELRFHSKALTAEEINAFNLQPDKIINNDTLIYLGSGFQVQTTASCASLFRWDGNGISDPAIAEPFITPTASATYKISFTHPDGCVADDTIAINVIDPNTLDCEKIFLPNAFTPSGSPGRNDRFGISNPFAVPDFISFEVFDRWGGRVFEGADRFDTWDGLFNGQPVNPGMFLYRLRYKCGGVEKVKSGNLMLLK
jgi:gliding motility-associated-like protein